MACSACGCTLNSDWASQGLAASGGWRFDLRDDYFDQTQLRSGTDAVSRSSLELAERRRNPAVHDQPQHHRFGRLQSEQGLGHQRIAALLQPLARHHRRRRYGNFHLARQRHRRRARGRALFGFRCAAQYRFAVRTQAADRRFQRSLRNRSARRRNRRPRPAARHRHDRSARRRVSRRRVLARTGVTSDRSSRNSRSIPTTASNPARD